MDNVVVVIIVAAFVVAAFLFGREFSCWYFKINERIEILKKIEAALNKFEKPPVK